MRNLLSGLVLLAWLQPAFAQDQYHVRFDDSLETVAVRACFDGPVPSRLYHHTQAGHFTDGINTSNTLLRIRSGNNSVKLPGLRSNSCLSWNVDLKQATRPEEMRLAMRVGGDLVMDTDLWFWRGSMQRDILVRVELPAGFSFSTPWAELGIHDGLREYF